MSIMHLLHRGSVDAQLRAAIAVWKMWAAACRENANEHCLAMRERAQNEVRRCMA